MTTRIITALDFDDPGRATALVERLDPALTRLKVGSQLFTLTGPAFVERLQKHGFDVFLDLKFHDIPNTVAGAVAAAASLGVWMVNVHASGGPRMLEAARDAVARMNPATRGDAATRLIAVTVLTSDAREDLAAVGVDAEPADRVLSLVRIAMDAGLDGVVCSAKECAAIRAIAPERFLLVTPGIRPHDPAAEGTPAADDQRRIVTPRAAIEAGSNHLVIGRPITAAPDPLKALESLHADIASTRGGVQA